MRVARSGRLCHGCITHGTPVFVPLPGIVTVLKVLPPGTTECVMDCVNSFCKSVLPYEIIPRCWQFPNKCFTFQPLELMQFQSRCPIDILGGARLATRIIKEH